MGTLGAHFIENACSFVVCTSIFFVAFCRIATAAWFCAFPLDAKEAFSAVCADAGVECPLEAASFLPLFVAGALVNGEILGLVQLHPFRLCFSSPLLMSDGTYLAIKLFVAGGLRTEYLGLCPLVFTWV